MSFVAQITADISNFENNIKRATSTVDSSTKKMQASFDRLGDSFINIGKRASILSAGVTALAFTAGRAAINFESAFAGVRKTVDATEAQFNSLSTGIRAMSKELPASAVEIAGVAEAAGQLGIQTESILAFTRTMIDLGEASNMASQEAATQLARFANITQMSQKDFDRLGATIVDLGNNLATTEGEMVEMSLRLAAAGKQVGMTEAEIVSFAGALSSVGIEAQAGGTAFSRVMSQMQLAVETGSSSLKDFASVAGMTVEEFSTAFRTNASGAIISFIEGLSRAKEEGTSTIKVLDDMGISEIRLRDALMRASGAGDLFRESIERGSIAWEENTALTEEAAQRYATTESRLKILKNTLTEVAIEFGEILLPHIQRVAESLKGVLERVNSLDPSIKKIIVAVSALTIALGPLLLALGKLLQILPLIQAAFTAMTGPIGIAVAAIVAATTLIIVHWDELKTASRNVVKYIKDDWLRLEQSLSATSSSIGNLMKGNFKGWLDDIKKSFDLTIDYLKNRWKQLKGIFEDEGDSNPNQQLLDAALAANEMTGAAGNTTKAIETLKEEIEETIIVASGLTEALDIFQSGTIAEAIRATSSEIKTLGKYLLDLQTGKVVVANVHDEIVKTQERLSVLNTALNTLTGNRELNIKVNTDSALDIFKATDFGSDAGLVIPIIPQIDTSLLENSLGQAKEMVTISSEQMGSLLSTGISMFAQTIGDAFAGNWDGLGAGLLKAVGSLAQQFGGLIVGMGVAALKLQSLITNPITAIAAGTALIALGALASKAAQNMMSSATSGGGYSSAPSLRNTGPTLGNSDYRGAYQDDFRVEFKIGSNELVGVLDTANQRRNRLG